MMLSQASQLWRATVQVELLVPSEKTTGARNRMRPSLVDVWLKVVACGDHYY
ncbi:MAG TPA: hypothetical protein VJ842_06640 [Pyrinomonadaceae bacterium]|nr:hypothetical protein [Pyrinomonadaceae bacterium]